MNINIDEYIRAQLENLDIREMVETEVRREIGKTIAREIERATKSRVEVYISDEMRAILTDGPIQIDDGWGRKETIPSFADLFKREFKKQLDSSWEMKRTVERQVQEKVASLMKTEFNAAAEKIVAEIIKSKS